MGTITAKAAIDNNVTKFRDKQLATGILTTDLSVAYDTCDSFLLLTKLEHIGVRGKEQELMRTYLTERQAYVEIQGFHSHLTPQPNCSVIQGSRLSTTLYTTYTLDVTEVESIMT